MAAPQPAGAKRSPKKAAAADEPSKLTPARRAALELTRELREREAYARELIDTRRTSWEGSQEDFDYMQVLVFGVVMTSGTLDLLIDRNLNSPKDVKPKVRDALRILSGAGYKATAGGSGYVAVQTPLPGTAAPAGSCVSLTLKTHTYARAAKKEQPKAIKKEEPQPAMKKENETKPAP